MTKKKLAAELAALKKDNKSLPLLFHLIEPREREFYISSYKNSRIINLGPYQDNRFVIVPFHKAISRIY